MHSDEIQSRKVPRRDAKQKSLLMQSFVNEPFPRKDKMQKLSEQLGLKVTTVKTWFKNERVRLRKRMHSQLPKRRFMCVCIFCACLRIK